MPTFERFMLWFNRPYMLLIRNLIWIFIGQGWLIFTFYLFGGLGLALTIVGFPLALAVWKLSIYVLWPSGLEFRRTEDIGVSKGLYYILIVVWLIFAGIALIVFHITLGFAALMTIIGIPAAIQHFKFLRNAINPFGLKSYPTEWARRSAHEIGRSSGTGGL
ncbi:hypothetical protein RCL1_005186 [Eukaryota sp. TZLM3-RCL]